MGEEYILCYQGQEPFTVTSQKEMAEHILKGAEFYGRAIPDGMALVKIEECQEVIEFCKSAESVDDAWMHHNFETIFAAAQGDRNA